MMYFPGKSYLFYEQIFSQILPKEVNETIGDHSKCTATNFSTGRQWNGWADHTLEPIIAHWLVLQTFITELAHLLKK